MSVQEIVIGRSSSCEINLGTECKYASKRHACVYKDGSNFMLRDFSTNGTWINGVRIQNRTVPIRRGDNIMIAGRYKVSWSVIDSFFHTDYVDNPPQTTLNLSQVRPIIDQSPEILPNFEWNWGAFSLFPLWGFWNGCWWAIFIGFFFGWMWPFPNLLFGISGSKWAWQNRSWISAGQFNSMQESWKPWGIAVFIINVLSIYFVWSFWLTFLFGISLVSL